MPQRSIGAVAARLPVTGYAEMARRPRLPATLQASRGCSFAEFLLARNFTEPPLRAGAAPAAPALLPRRRAPSRGASRRRSSPPAPGGGSSSGTRSRTR
uniref:Uncharacterized protein n=1 Tax=Arundo donax TaxID=35708 RepID=A0A0A9GDT6_ARUDO